MMAQSANMPPDENAKLMRKAADDDVEAFERLHQRFASILMHLFTRRRIDHTSADDLVQRIFTSLWEQRKSFRGESSFETYLFSVARRTLVRELRRFREIAEINLEKHSESIVDSPTGLSQPEAELYLQELTTALQAAKAKLTAEQRRALEASLAGEVPFGKASEELGCSPGAFKSRLKRARKRLRELLAPFLGDDKTPNKG